MGNTADKLNYLEGTKAAIRQSIETKGVIVNDSDTFRDYANKILQIKGGAEAYPTGSLSQGLISCWYARTGDIVTLTVNNYTQTSQVAIGYLSADYRPASDTLSVMDVSSDRRIGIKVSATTGEVIIGYMNTSNEWTTASSSLINSFSTTYIVGKEIIIVPEDATLGDTTEVDGVKAVMFYETDTHKYFVDKEHDLDYYYSGLTGKTFNSNYNYGTANMNITGANAHMLKSYSSLGLWAGLKQFRTSHSDNWYIPSKTVANNLIDYQLLLKGQSSVGWWTCNEDESSATNYAYCLVPQTDGSWKMRSTVKSSERSTRLVYMFTKG